MNLDESPRLEIIKLLKNFKFKKKNIFLTHGGILLAVSPKSNDGSHISIKVLMGWQLSEVTKIDGTVKIDSGYVIVGRVLRDERGEWLLDFNRRLGNALFFMLNYEVS